MQSIVKRAPTGWMERSTANPGSRCGTEHISELHNNWMFAWNELGARQVGIVQSLLVTPACTISIPYDYFVYVLQRVDLP
jgi:hypothetical protein